MKDFNLRKYLAENNLLKEITFDDVKAAAKIKSGGDGFSIPYEFGTINMYNRPSGGDGTGDVGVEYESGGTTQDTDFVSYEKAIDIIKKNLAESNIDEIRFPQTDFTRSQLVPRMESMVDRETYKKFTDSLDNLLDDWYMEGFEKDDVLAFMKVIIPSS